MIVLRPKKGTPEVEKDELKEALAEGKQKLQDIRDLGRSIHDAPVRNEVAELSGVIEKILATISEDSKKLRPARQFLGSYLDSTIKIIRTYAELESKGVRDADIQASMAKAQGMLGTIRDAFDKQLAKLLSGDVLDLDAELSLMQQTIDMEGLGKGAGTKLALKPRGQRAIVRPEQGG